MAAHPALPAGHVQRLFAGHGGKQAGMRRDQWRRAADPLLVPFGELVVPRQRPCHVSTPRTAPRNPRVRHSSQPPPFGRRELPHHDEVARFIPEYVMAQLESPAAWDRLPFTTARYLVVVVNETGLRGGHACRLPVNPGARRRQRLAMPALGDHQGAPWRPSACQQDGQQIGHPCHKPCHAFEQPCSTKAHLPGSR